MFQYAIPPIVNHHHHHHGSELLLSFLNRLFGLPPFFFGTLTLLHRKPWQPLQMIFFPSPVDHSYLSLAFLDELHRKQLNSVALSARTLTRGAFAWLSSDLSLSSHSALVLFILLGGLLLFAFCMHLLWRCSKLEAFLESEFSHSLWLMDPQYVFVFSP